MHSTPLKQRMVCLWTDFIKFHVVMKAVQLFILWLSSQPRHFVGNWPVSAHSRRYFFELTCSFLHICWCSVIFQAVLSQLNSSVWGFLWVTDCVVYEWFSDYMLINVLIKLKISSILRRAVSQLSWFVDCFRCALISLVWRKPCFRLMQS